MVYITLQNVMETEMMKDINLRGCRVWVRVAREGGERLASQPPQPTRGPSSLPSGAGPALPPALAAGAAGLPGVGWAGQGSGQLPCLS